MKRFIRKYWSDIIMITALLILFLDSCSRALEMTLVHPIASALAIMCIISYSLYYQEIERRRERRMKLEMRRRKEEQRAQQFISDYREFRREYEEKSRRTALEVWDM